MATDIETQTDHIKMSIDISYSWHLAVVLAMHDKMQIGDILMSRIHSNLRMPCVV